MKIYGNGFTMIDSNEYDLIQMINRIDIERVENKDERKEKFNRVFKTFAIGIGLLTTQFVVGTLLKGK